MDAIHGPRSLAVPSMMLACSLTGQVRTSKLRGYLPDSALSIEARMTRHIAMVLSAALQRPLAIAKGS